MIELLLVPVLLLPVLGVVHHPRIDGLGNIVFRHEQLLLLLFTADSILQLLTIVQVRGLELRTLCRPTLIFKMTWRRERQPSLVRVESPIGRDRTRHLLVEVPGRQDEELVLVNPCWVLIAVLVIVLGMDHVQSSSYVLGTDQTWWGGGIARAVTHIWRHCAFERHVWVYDGCIVVYDRPPRSRGAGANGPVLGNRNNRRWVSELEWMVVMLSCVSFRRGDGWACISRIVRGLP